MEMSHVADDFPAIARRLKEISEERQKAEEQQGQPARAAGNGFDWIPRSAGQSGHSRRTWSQQR